MRLLRLDTGNRFSLVEFLGDLPRYAILSHTWGAASEEVTYQDLLNGTGKEKEGYRKLRFCGQQADKDGIYYMWIDTCCIDKSSSSELSEAINSMYFWYSKAVVCYVYLSDIHHVDGVATALGSSKWFTRGWTLQEFLAPKAVVFFSAEWEFLGDKKGLEDELHRITKIPLAAMQGTPPSRFSIAQRMSWASKRRTTRIEDMAYSLMGIFDVNMPLLYGEREKAFRRLQQHILQESNDQSLFAWKDPSLNGADGVSIFAQSLAQFEHSGTITSLEAWSLHDSATITHNGLRIELWLIRADTAGIVFLASLACGFKSSHNHSPGIYLKRLSGDGSTWRADHKTQFVRVRGNELEELRGDMKIRGEHCTVHVRQEGTVVHFNDPITMQLDIFYINRRWTFSEELAKQFGNYTVLPSSSWNPQTNVFTAKRTPGPLGAIRIQHRHVSTMTVFGVLPNGAAWINTQCRQSFANKDWSTYVYGGTETETSQAVIQESKTGQVIFETMIYSRIFHTKSGREIFVIEITEKNVALPITTSLPPF